MLQARRAIRVRSLQCAFLPWWSVCRTDSASASLFAHVVSQFSASLKLLPFVFWNNCSVLRDATSNLTCVSSGLVSLPLHKRRLIRTMLPVSFQFAAKLGAFKASGSSGVCVTPMLRSLALLTRHATGGRRTSLNSLVVCCVRMSQRLTMFLRDVRSDSLKNMCWLTGITAPSKVQKKHQAVLSRGRAAGPGDIPIELVAAGGVPAVRTLSQVLRFPTEYARAPAQWRGGRLADLWKKNGGSAICSNSRGILLGDHWG